MRHMEPLKDDILTSFVSPLAQEVIPPTAQAHGTSDANPKSPTLSLWQSGLHKKHHHSKGRNYQGPKAKELRMFQNQSRPHLLPTHLKWMSKKRGDNQSCEKNWRNMNLQIWNTVILGGFPKQTRVSQVGCAAKVYKCFKEVLSMLQKQVEKLLGKGPPMLHSHDLGKNPVLCICGNLQQSGHRYIST